MSLEERYVDKKRADPNEAIGWELYKNLTYGYITGQFEELCNSNRLIESCFVMSISCLQISQEEWRFFKLVEISLIYM